jgi:hypothetical protein
MWHGFNKSLEGSPIHCLNSETRFSPIDSGDKLGQNRGPGLLSLYDTVSIKSLESLVACHSKSASFIAFTQTRLQLYAIDSRSELGNGMNRGPDHDRFAQIISAPYFPSVTFGGQIRRTRNRALNPLS